MPAAKINNEKNVTIQPRNAAIPGGQRRRPPGMAAFPAVKLMPE